MFDVARGDILARSLRIGAVTNNRHHGEDDYDQEKTWGC